MYIANSRPLRSRGTARAQGALGALLTLSLSVTPIAAYAQSTEQQDYSTGSDISSSSTTGDSTSTQGQGPGATYSTGNVSAIQQTQAVTPTTVNPTGIADTTANAILAQSQENITPSLRQPPEPNEFQKYVESRLGKSIPRFGANLIVPSSRDFTVPPTTTVPPSYVLQPGDTVFIGLSGSVDGSVENKIDNDGNIFLAKVGSIHLAGIRYSDLKTVIQRAVGTQYRGFYVSVSVTRLHGIQVYVTGFANNPGSYTVNSLSTLINAVLAAGGPSSGGSFRSIRLYRNGELVTDFDLYDLILNGDKSKDVLLQNGDVIRIDPVGEQVAITGSVNREAIYEARPDESLADVIKYAGGLNGLADKSRIILYRLADAAKGGIEISASALANERVAPGDIVQALSVGSLVRSLDSQAVLVRIDGEVNRPGNYYVQPGATLGDVLQRAGGLTPSAYVYGAVFERQSVRLQQRASFEEAVRQVELSLAAAPLTAEEGTEQTDKDQLAAAKDVVNRLRAAQPDGRVVLPVAYNAPSLPMNLPVENNDTIYIPPKPMTVGVFGAVYRPASFLLRNEKRDVKDYLNDAGGPIGAADKGEIFLVRANGEVISRHRDVMGAAVHPGDVIFVPVKNHGNRFWSHLTSITRFVLGTGVSAATIRALTK